MTKITIEDMPDKMWEKLQQDYSEMLRGGPDPNEYTFDRFLIETIDSGIKVFELKDRLEDKVAQIETVFQEMKHDIAEVEYPAITD